MNHEKLTGLSPDDAKKAFEEIEKDAENLVSNKSKTQRFKSFIKGKIPSRKKSGISSTKLLTTKPLTLLPLFGNQLETAAGAGFDWGVDQITVWHAKKNMTQGFKDLEDPQKAELKHLCKSDNLKTLDESRKKVVEARKNAEHYQIKSSKDISKVLRQLFYYRHRLVILSERAFHISTITSKIYENADKDIDQFDKNYAQVKQNMIMILEGSSLEELEEIANDHEA